MVVCINIINNVTVEPNFSITLQANAVEGTAKIGDFEMSEREVVISMKQTCFEIMIFLDAILEHEEIFQLFIESTDSALNISLPQAEITILDSTSKLVKRPVNVFSILSFSQTVHQICQSTYMSVSRSYRF